MTSVKKLEIVYKNSKCWNILLNFIRSQQIEVCILNSETGETQNFVMHDTFFSETGRFLRNLSSFLLEPIISENMRGAPYIRFGGVRACDRRKSRNFVEKYMFKTRVLADYTSGTSFSFVGLRNYRALLIGCVASVINSHFVLVPLHRLKSWKEI